MLLILGYFYLNLYDIKNLIDMSAALKYLWALVIPAVLVTVLYFRGYFSYGGVIVAFMAIPLLELLLKDDSRNFNLDEENKRLKNFIFDLTLYINVPILWAILVWCFFVLNNIELQTYEYIGIVISMGVFLGSIGINVAHELGHRNSWYEKLFAYLLLLPNLYMHFRIEHNRGHHLNVATKEDPASARLNESLYFFWIRSVVMSYLSAWKLEGKRLKNEGKSVFSMQNEMMVLQIIQVVYLFVVWCFGGYLLLFSAIFIAIVGFLMLETVNYIEHYGLERKKMENGRYERVQPWHSWNSNHILGRVMLYELSRHSDHHFKASKKYQVLRHYDESPQLPFGYPMSMVISFIPPLWFYLMNPKVQELKMTDSLNPDL
jgi:alkane 1-monooxygenase